MKYDYLGPFIHSVAEFRINGEVGFINKYGERVNKNGERIHENSKFNDFYMQNNQILIATTANINE